MGYLWCVEMKGNTAIITGASGQLGSQIAQSLARLGINCLCHYFENADGANECVESIQALGVRAEGVQADFNNPALVATLIEQADQLGPVRVLVNSSSLFKRQPLGEFVPEDVTELLNVNLVSPLNLCNAFAMYLKQQESFEVDSPAPIAAIINLVDVAGIRPWAEYSPYCASRAGMIGMTTSLAKELAPAVTVNAIAPGIVTWPGMRDPSEEEKQLKKIPAGRFGHSKDITRTIEFLLNNDYITGQVICVDGGRSL